MTADINTTNDEVVEIPPPTAPTNPDPTTNETKDPLDDGKLKPHHKLFLDPYAPGIYEIRKKSKSRKCTDAQKLEDKAHEELCARYPDELVPAGDFLPSVKLYFKNKMRKYRERDEEQAAARAKATTSNASGKRQQTIEEVILPKVTAKSLYKFENHEEIVEVAVEKAGKDNKRNPSEYQKTRKAGYDSLPIETKQDYEKRAREMNEENAVALRRPATDEEIIQNQLEVRERIREFLVGLIGEGYLQIGEDVSFHLEGTYASRRDGGVPVGFVLDVSGKSVPSFTKSRYYKKDGNGYAEFSDIVFKKLLEKRLARAGSSIRNTIDLTGDGETAPPKEASGTALTGLSAQDSLLGSDTSGPALTENIVNEQRKISVTIEGAPNDIEGLTLRHLNPHDALIDDLTNVDRSQAAPTSTNTAPTSRQYDQIVPVEKSIGSESQDPVVSSAKVLSPTQPISPSSVTSNGPSADLVTASASDESPSHANAHSSFEPRTEPDSLLEHTSSNDGPNEISDSTLNGEYQNSSLNESMPVIGASKEQSKGGKRTKVMAERANKTPLQPRITRSRANKPAESTAVANSPEKGRGKREIKLSAKAQAAKDTAVISRKRGADENANEATISRKKAKKA